jgi:hypothetical protein
MKKNRAVLHALIPAAAAAIVFIAATTCTNPVADILGSKSWGLVGTWGNSTYVAAITVTHCGVLDLKADNTYRCTDANGGQVTTGTYAVADVTAAGTVRTYHIQFTNDPPAPITTWVLAVVADGTTYESVSSLIFGAYPASLATGSNYGILTLM